MAGSNVKLQLPKFSPFVSACECKGGGRARLLPSLAAATQAIFIDLFFNCGKNVHENHKDCEFSSSKNR